ncbi:MAG: lipopolysaccharide export system protein LptA [Alphaproteobacteria bacterium]|jgi:lipopolysaccharide export system protein LptA
MMPRMIFPMRRAGSQIVSAAIMLCLLGMAGVSAQGIGLPNQTRDTPIEILADQGIEWQQDNKVYIARGNAKARQGDVTIHADTLTAYYHKSADGSTEIWRIDADGNVRITSPRQTAYGTKGVYDVERGIFVLTGAPRLVTATESISATQSLEFWEKKSLAVARGNALAIKEDKRIRADVLTAHFTKGRDGKNEMNRVEAFDNVIISSPKEIVRARRGVYNTKTGIVVLRGGVKITRGGDQLNGDAAEVNLNTGVSRMLGGEAKRVRGSFKARSLKDRPGTKGSPVRK